MKLAVFKIWSLAVIVTCSVCNAFGQHISGVNLKNYATALTNLRELKPIEKLYLQTDKPHYNIGDTLWFKGYLLDGVYLTPSGNSGLLYIELDNEQGKCAKRIMVPVAGGAAWGAITLDSTEVQDGTYILRAYTNWMRNFGEDYVFKKKITISKSTDNPLLVKANFRQIGNKTEAELYFSSLDGRIHTFRDVELKVMNGRRNLLKDKFVTSADGAVKVNFNLPESAGALSIQANSAGGLLNIPVLFNRKEHTDLQFMPEGGQLVAGITAKVGFKAIAEDGKGADISGKLFDEKGNQVAVFSAAHAGMGSFEFTPLANKAYYAKIDGVATPYPFPLVKQDGTTLSVTSMKDTVQVVINTTPGAAGDYVLVAQANGLVCFAKAISINKTFKVSVEKSLFPTGITRLTLFKGYLPINERIVFIDHQDKLNISIRPNKAAYKMRDSIALAIKVTDKHGVPIEGNFLIAVTDNSQVKTDSLGANILNHLLLTSDLKGNIENPDYYFTPGKEIDLDNMLLTQGWTGYDWQEAFQPKPPYQYRSEKEFEVSGKVTTAFGRPIEKSNVILIANNPLTFKDTLTDNTGRFVFKDLFPVDTAIFKLQARNKKGKDMNVKIEMDETILPTFKPPRLSVPWYVNIDSILLSNAKAKVDEATALSRFRGEGNVLKEVNIKSKKVIKGSKNLNGPGEADQIIDEEELVKANKMTLEELLAQKVKGYSFVTPTKSGPLYYTINRRPISLIIDGFNVNYFYTGRSLTEKFHFMKTYMDYFTAEDITGIEVLFNDRYIANYNMEFLSSGGLETIRLPPSPRAPIVYLEITTRSKKGPFMQVTPGTYLYKTIPFSVAKQFYSPKYTVKNKGTALGTDMRSTIFWEPNVVTDKEGMATIYFYGADMTANYTVLLEGTDMNGNFGYKSQTISITR